MENFIMSNSITSLSINVGGFVPALNKAGKVTATAEKQSELLNALDSRGILSPVSANTFKQAIYGGADAVYFGYGVFNARAGAENFNSIGEVVDFCHFYNVKAYLALN